MTTNIGSQFARSWLTFHQTIVNSTAQTNTAVSRQFPRYENAASRRARLVSLAAIMSSMQWLILCCNLSRRSGCSGGIRSNRSRSCSYKIIANVDLTNEAQGVIFAHGSRFGGHALFIKDGMLHYVYNFLGIKPEQDFVSERLTPGKHSLGMEFTRESSGKNGESIGTTTLYIDDKVVTKGPMRAQIGKFTLAGDGLCVGFDSGDSVSQQYRTPGNFTGGTIQGVAIDISGTVAIRV